MMGENIEFKIKEDKKQKRKHIEIRKKGRAKQRKEISMTSPSLKTCDEDSDESTEKTNNESGEELFIILFFILFTIGNTKSKTATEVERPFVGFIETPTISKNSKFV